MDANTQARTYIRRIRNERKQAYAVLVWDHMRRGTEAPHIGREFLSVMAQQAVRDNLRAICR